MYFPDKFAISSGTWFAQNETSKPGDLSQHSEAETLSTSNSSLPSKVKDTARQLLNKVEEDTKVAVIQSPKAKQKFDEIFAESTDATSIASLDQTTVTIQSTPVSTVQPEINALLRLYKKAKFKYTDKLTQQPPNFDLFTLEKTITLQKDTKKIEVDMREEGRVELVSNSPVYLYTDYLGPCVAAIGRCKVSDSSMLIGVTHLFPEDEDYSKKLDSLLSRIPMSKYKYLNKEKIIKDQQFEPRKLNRLIDEFAKHPSYKDEEIELFFAGGNGDQYVEFWRELTVEYARSNKVIKVIGTFFNPYESTQEIRDEIKKNKGKLSFLAGITNEGSILLHKSHDISFKFQLSIFNSIFKP